MDRLNRQNIVLYDGDCRLCHWFVRLLIGRNKKERFSLVPLQSEEGKRRVERLGITIAREPESVLLIQEGKVYQRSEAVLRILYRMGGGYVLFYPLIFLPVDFRDSLYDWIARNRHRFFGRRINCRLPIPQEGETI